MHTCLYGAESDIICFLGTFSLVDTLCHIIKWGSCTKSGWSFILLTSIGVVASVELFNGLDLSVRHRLALLYH